MCLGEMLGGCTTKHRQNQLSRSTYFNLAYSPQAGRIRPSLLPAAPAELFDVLTCPPQASYTLYLSWTGRKKKPQIIFKPICWLALKYAASSLECTFSVIRSLPEPVLTHSRVPLPSFIITCCSSETSAA